MMTHTHNECAKSTYHISLLHKADIGLFKHTDKNKLSSSALGYLIKHRDAFQYFLSQFCDQTPSRGNNDTELKVKAS